MLSNIVKKITSTNVSKAKLLAIADILNIKTTKMDDSKYLSHVKADLKKDRESSFLEKAKINLKSDEIEVAKARRQVKTLPKRAPKPTTKKSDDTQTQKVYDAIDKINESTKKSGKHFFYLIYNDDVKLVSNEKTEVLTKKAFNQRVAGKDKYVDSSVYSVSISISEKYVGKPSNLVGGPVALQIKEYKLNDKLKLSYEADYKYGAVWYTNDDLRNNLFKMKDIRDIIKQIDDRNINILGIGKIRAVDILKDTSRPKTKKKVEAKAVPSVEQPKQQLTWVEHVKKYAKDHNVSYRDALKQAGATYVKKQKTKAPKKPKEKKVHEYHCEFCNYTSTDKSNFNRHMKKHTDREKLLKELMSARGLIRTHKVRADKSKNKDVRDASQAILTKALETERMIVNILKKLESGTLKSSTAKTLAKKASAGTKKVPKYAEALIERINKSYEDNNEEELGLTKAKITEFKRTGDDIIMRVKDLAVDDGEIIDSVELEHDGKMDGYNVTLSQDAEIKGQVQSLEYDQFYMY